MKFLSAICLSVALATGCSTVKSWMPGQSNDSPGAQMLSQSKQTKTLGKTWNEGQDLVEKGQKLMSKSQKLSLDSQNAKTEAEGLIARGESLISNSEDSYRTAFGGPSTDTRSGGSSTR